MSVRASQSEGFSPVARYAFPPKKELEVLLGIEAELVQLTQADREYWLLKAVRARLHADLKSNGEFRKHMEARYNQMVVEDVDLDAAIEECAHQGIAINEIETAYNDRARWQLK